MINLVARDNSQSVSRDSRKVPRDRLKDSLDNSVSARPIKVMFVITSLPVGGAERLLLSLVRTFDRRKVEPAICCLKEPGELGAEIAREAPVFSGLIRSKYDFFVLWRLRKLMIDQGVQAVITVGAGDKMFWGRLAAFLAGVPVVLSALHSTGWPDGVGTLNRILTPITDGFIGVAAPHGQFLVQSERFPAAKVFVIPNGIDTQLFRHNRKARIAGRQKLGIPINAPTVGIVAALRSEKNHLRFLRVARVVADRLPNAHFVIAGDGPEKSTIEEECKRLGLSSRVRMLGTVGDVPALLSMLDLFALTSDNEASPVSIIEAMSCELPVVAPNVGSISSTVLAELTGILHPVADEQSAAEAWVRVLRDPELAKCWGSAGRDRVNMTASLESMTLGYQELVARILESKKRPSRKRAFSSAFAALGRGISLQKAAR